MLRCWYSPVFVAEAELHWEGSVLDKIYTLGNT